MLTGKIAIRCSAEGPFDTLTATPTTRSPSSGDAGRPSLVCRDATRMGGARLRVQAALARVPGRDPADGSTTGRRREARSPPPGIRMDERPRGNGGGGSIGYVPTVDSAAAPADTCRPFVPRFRVRLMSCRRPLSLGRRPAARLLDLFLQRREADGESALGEPMRVLHLAWRVIPLGVRTSSSISNGAVTMPRWRPVAVEWASASTESQHTGRLSIVRGFPTMVCAAEPGIASIPLACPNIGPRMSKAAPKPPDVITLSPGIRRERRASNPWTARSWRPHRKRETRRASGPLRDSPCAPS